MALKANKLSIPFLLPGKYITLLEHQVNQELTTVESQEV